MAIEVVDDFRGRLMTRAGLLGVQLVDELRKPGRRICGKAIRNGRAGSATSNARRSASTGRGGSGELGDLDLSKSGALD